MILQKDQMLLLSPIIAILVFMVVMTLVVKITNYLIIVCYGGYDVNAKTVEIMTYQ